MVEMNKLIDKLIALDIIEPSKSGWNSRIVMVRKPNGTYRLCIDYRDVNKVSKRDAYPLPSMSNILDTLQEANYISSIDLELSFHQVPLELQSREVTAFSVPGRGHFQYKTMPFGLTGSPATFQRLIEKILGPDMEPFVFSYLDDVIVATRTFEDHMKWLKEVLRRIKEAGLTINPDKCMFFRNEIRYLGFMVNNEGVKIDPAKLAPVLDFPSPQNLRQLRRFLGFASWYRRFIPNLSTAAEPLTLLLRSKQQWKWESDQASAFKTIKETLTSAPVVACPDFSKPFTLQTDASGFGLGVVLTQIQDDSERVISYASHTLSKAERNYSATER